jgi:outer membrane receptor protein involved in Fe transport
VINPATNLQRQATTDGDGRFIVVQLPPSRYTVRVENTGFSATEIQDIELNVNDQRAISVQLKVGGVGATVQVDSEASLIDESPAVATTINRQFVQNLPLNGRSFQSLFELTPGVVLTPSGDGGQGQFSVNGQRTNSNYITVDGVGANVSAAVGNTLGQNATGSVPGFAATGGTNNLVSVDALQEFKIQTSTYAPEFGRTPGAQVSIVTRSGTNRFTGAVFEYFRNEAFDANDFFANRNGFDRAPLRQHNFGGVLGGRIVKDRTFFFFSYEGLRLQQPQQQSFFVPSDALRASAAPSLRPFINAFPRANGPLDFFNGQPTGYATFNAVYSDKTQLDATSIRIDHNFTDKFTLFGRFNESPSSAVNRLTNPSTPGTTKANTRTLTIGASQIFSNNLVNDLRFNYTRYKSSLNLALDTLGGGVPFDLSTVPGVSSAARPVFGVFLVDINPNTFASRFAPGIFLGELSNSKTQQYNLVDNLSYQTGSHSLKFGFDYRRLNPTFLQYDYFNTLAIFTAASLTRNLFGNGPNPILAGAVNQIQVRADEGERNPIFNNYSFYAQDTWKATQYLTFTFGARYEVNPAPRERDGKNPVVVTNLSTPANIALAPAGAPLYKTTYNNIAPRFGVSWQATTKPGFETVLRGGVGVFYDLGGGSAAGSVFSNTFPFVSSKTESNFNGIPYPLTEAQIAPAPIRTTLPATTEVFAFEDGLKLPRTYQFNAAIEQSLGSHQTFSISYVGARGEKLLRQDFIQSPNANFPNGVVVTRNSAESAYDAMQLQFTRRLTRGFQALASYTVSQSTDTASNDIARTASLLVVPTDNDRGPSDFDIRHVFTGAVTYNFPTIFKENRVAKAIFGGWASDAIFRYRSATPVNVVVNNLNFSSNGGASTTRPNIVPGQPFYLEGDHYPGGKAINPAAFVSPGAGNRGDLGRNALRGFSARQLDMTLRRDFQIRENMGIQLRAEVFNVTNTPNFGNPENRLGNPNFGLATQMLGRSLSNAGNGGAGLSSAFQIGGPRSIQLSARFYF